MTKKIIKHYLILLVIFFSWVGFANANLEITEIMYAPEGGSNYEWVEVNNNGSDPIDLNKYRFFHGETTSGPITLKSGDTTVLQPSEYAIIAKSLTDYSWLDFSDMVFSASTLSLPDSGDNTYIAISDPNKSIIDEVIYDTSKGGSKDSKSSLSKINGEWQSGVPTPGKENILNTTEDTPSDTNNDTSDINSSSSSTLSSSSNEEIPIIPKITTKIISPKTVTSGIPFSLSSLTTTNAGETYAVGKFVWNFGDGMVKEVSKAEPFDYTFDYPGEYVVTLSYFDSLLNKVSDATDKMTIKVIPSEIYISSVGDNADPFIEIENKSNYEIVLSNWMVTAGVHYFIIPNGTSILPGKKIKLSPKITGFVGEDIKSVSINDPSNNVVATYPAQKIKTISKSVTVTKPVSNNAVSPSVSLPEESQVINLNDLSAEAENSGANIPKSFYPFLGLIVVIGLGISGFLIIRKRNKGNNLYDEKRIRAEDITIME